MAKGDPEPALPDFDNWLNLQPTVGPGPPRAQKLVTWSDPPALAFSVEMYTTLTPSFPSCLYDSDVGRGLGIGKP